MVLDAGHLAMGEPCLTPIWHMTLDTLVVVAAGIVLLVICVPAAWMLGLLNTPCDTAATGVCISYFLASRCMEGIAARNT